MKRNCLVLIFLFMLLLTASAFAITGDISIRINGVLPNGAPQMLVGQDNILEFWVTNSKKLSGMSLGFEINNDGLPYSLVHGLVGSGNEYGTVPADTLETLPPNDLLPVDKYMMEHGNFLPTFGGANNFCVVCLASNEILFGGASPNAPANVPVHLTSTLGYSVKVRIPPLEAAGHFCIRPVFVPPGGAWKIIASTTEETNPNFQGQPTTSSADPGIDWAHAACFDRDQQPCVGPSFVNVPGFAVSSSHAGYTFHFTANVGEIGPLTFSVVSTPAGATIDPSSGVLSVPGVCPQATTHVVVTAHNGCPAGGTADYAFDITWTNATPVITNCPAANLSTGLGATYTRLFTATDADPGDAAGLVWSVSAGATIPGGVFTFNPVAVGIFPFTVTATDVCGGFTTCTFNIEVTSFNIVKIPKLGEKLGVGPHHDYPGLVFQGTYTHVPINLSGSALSLAGYNLLIHYDGSALSFVSAEIGAPLQPCAKNGSGWEYFTYRFGADGNCGGPCPSGMLRLVALAETNNGPNHPGCGGTKDPFDIYGEIANLKFYVTNDRNYECQYVEVGFAWLDCSDNSFSDPTGNKLYIAANKAVHTFEWDGLDLDSVLIPCEHYPNVNGIIYGGFCVPDCEANVNKPVYENIYFWNGGVDIACADSIDARGDINLNGIANEIADAVLFTNFFLKGITAFYDDPYVASRVQGKVAATDVNADGHPLTVGDLVYLLRIIVGDAMPYTKLSPFASGATVNFANGSVSTVSGSEIGAVYATFAINGAYDVVSNTNMQVSSGEVNGELKVLVYSGMSNLSNRIASGTNELFTVSGNVELKSVEVADYYGNMLSARVNKISLPTSFALSQNVPNPFNPTTKLGFALPNQSEWTLSIYNVAGQLVKNFSGNNIGNVSVEWDASMAPSGVYFYKLNAGSYSDTKKMVLMK